MSHSFLERLGSLLYIVNPKTSTFEHASDVPNYVDEAVPLFFLLMVLEAIVRKIQGKEVRLNEAICSVGVGILHEATVFMSGTIMFLGYEWLYQYRVFNLPWNSLYTWFAAFVFIDFCYYWVHRANHEINILWAAHQVHHSSEDYNLTISLRLSIFQRAAYFGFYLPLALIGLPFSMALVHAALNYLFQFWVHTDLFRHIGPLEYVLMCPSHHRVHHGSNKWCLDKNYASVFIVWDRIFGTFEAERENEEIVYGLTDQPQTHNPVYMEFFYFKIIYEKAKSMSNWPDRLKAFLYGPGWFPGTPRLGDPDTFPDIRAPRKKYDPSLPLWALGYLMVHMFIVLIGQQMLLYRISITPWTTILLNLISIFVSVGVMGSLLDQKWWAPLMETCRCSAYIAYASNAPFTNIPMVDSLIITCFAVSMTLWGVRSIHILTSRLQATCKIQKLE